MNNKSRNINLDVVRTVAVLSVLSVHFFLNSGYYGIPLNSPIMYWATIIRTIFLICVPLFILLTGFLMNKKTISKKYYINILKVIITYILSTLTIIVFKIVVLHENLSVIQMIQNIISFEQYSWYIEMYIGLYLLIPFLNIIYNNCSNEQKKLLIAVLSLMTSVPAVVNSFGYSILPDFWTEFYPITYYFIGAYLSENYSRIKASTITLFAMFILVIIVAGTFIYYKSNGGCYVWGDWGTWESIFNVCTSTLLFATLLKIDFSRIPSGIVKVISTISKVSLPLYLTSWISDRVVYNAADYYVAEFSEKLMYAPLIVGLSFVLALIMAVLINGVSNLVNKMISR